MLRNAAVPSAVEHELGRSGLDGRSLDRYMRTMDDRLLGPNKARALTAARILARASTGFKVETSAAVELKLSGPEECIRCLLSDPEDDGESRTHHPALPHHSRRQPRAGSF